MLIGKLWDSIVPNANFWGEKVYAPDYFSCFSVAQNVKLNLTQLYAMPVIALILNPNKIYK